MIKVIVVTGGVLSGLGKGVAAASIGHLLAETYTVVPLKCDGYLNVDPGTMNPLEHGEVFVLDDGTEVDMDFGHYERFLGVSCTNEMSLTMGKVFDAVRQKERNGEYLGKTVQFVPHVSGYIKEYFHAMGEKGNVLLIEIGGTIGDIENELYLEAARELCDEIGRENCVFVHLTYVPKPAWLGEHKTKPTQQSVQLLLQRGVVPDIIITRSTEVAPKDIREKIKRWTNASLVVSGHDVSDVYSIPQNFYDQGMLAFLNGRLGLQATYANMWSGLTTLEHTTTVRVGIAGKYTALEDSYASIAEALRHSGAHTQSAVEIVWIETTDISSQEHAKQKLAGIDAVIVPGGFGDRGVEGKIRIITHCRENNIPFLGICYGMQLAVVEFARNVVGLTGAHTTEVHPQTPHPVVDMLPEQLQVTQLGGTMRLGAYSSPLSEGIIQQLYGATQVSERHRHRYEVNPKYHEQLSKQGLVFSGMNGVLAEFIELPRHQYFVGTQAHPELKSTLHRPAPLFLGLVQAAKDKV